jgi:hypothetical protein
MEAAGIEPGRPSNSSSWPEAAFTSMFVSQVLSAQAIPFSEAVSSKGLCESLEDGS